MKQVLLIIITIILTFSASLYIADKVNADVNITDTLLITAALPNPTGSDADNEWIELYNSSPETINLKEYTLKINDKDQVDLSATDLIIQPSEFLYLAAKPHIFSENFPNEDFKVENLPISIYNKSSQIKLFNKASESFSHKFEYTNYAENIITKLEPNCDKYFELSFEEFKPKQLDFPEICEKDPIDDQTDPNNTKSPQEHNTSTKITSSDNKNNTANQTEIIANRIESMYSKLSSDAKINLDLQKITRQKISHNQTQPSFQTITLPVIPTKHITLGQIFILIALNLTLVMIYLEFRSLWLFHKSHQ
jgi:hypothetical protein